MNKSNKTVTMTDVAKRVGCTLRVVSAILNNKDRNCVYYSDKLAEETRKVAIELGYVDKSGKEITLGARKILFVFVFGVQENLSQLMTSNISSACKSLNLESLVYFCHGNEGKTDLEDFIRKWDIDGVIVIHHINDEVLSLFESRQLPVLFFNPVEELPNNSIFFDDRSLAEKLFPLLVTMGIDTIAYLRYGENLNPNGHYTQNLRRELTRENAARHKIDLCGEFESTNIVSQVLALNDLSSQRDRILVLAYAGLSFYQDFFLERNSIITDLIYPKKIDFFSYDKDNDLAFAYGEYPRKRAMHKALEHLTLMIESKSMIVDNQNFSGEIVVKRTPFKTA